MHRALILLALASLASAQTQFLQLAQPWNAGTIFVSLHTHDGAVLRPAFEFCASIMRPHKQYAFVSKLGTCT